MKKPIFDQWERMEIREIPDSLSNTRFQMMKAEREIKNEIIKLVEPILPYRFYVYLLFIIIILLGIYYEV